jgi:hypothetical protein
VDQPLFEVICHTAPSLPRTKTSIRAVLAQEIEAGDAVHTPPRESQVPPPDVCQRAPLVSTAKKSRYPVDHSVLTAGPVPVIVWPLTLAALLTTAKSDTSIRVAKTMLIIVMRFWFIRFAFLED